MWRNSCFYLDSTFINSSYKVLQEKQNKTSVKKKCEVQKTK